LLGTFSAIDGPSGQSFNSELVDKENLPKAVGFNVTNFHSARIIGPAITGFIIKAFGTGPAFFINAVSFLFVVGGLLLMNSDEILRIKAPDEKPKIAEAWHYIRSRPDITLVILKYIFYSNFWIEFSDFLILYLQLRYFIKMQANMEFLVLMLRQVQWLLHWWQQDGANVNLKRSSGMPPVLEYWRCFFLRLQII
jgi:MFS family permease